MKQFETPDPRAIGKKCQRCGAPGFWINGAKDEVILCLQCRDEWYQTPDDQPRLHDGTPIFSFSPERWYTKLSRFVNNKAARRTVTASRSSTPLSTSHRPEDTTLPKLTKVPQ